MNSKLWIRIALFNLFLVALLGTLMRYKIGFEFPYFNQKYIQEAHSHFAFTGWITHTLYFLTVWLFKNNQVLINEKKYQMLLVGNLLVAYGMLVSFFYQGYGSISIGFSVLSILIGYIFSIFALKDLRKLHPSHPSRNWMIAAIWFGIISTIGTGVLAYMMATFKYDQNIYLSSVYFYLHFQYNGWFLFACLGLFFEVTKHYPENRNYLTKAFWFFFLSGLPTYFLSTLWADIPLILYVFVIIASILQFIGWFYVLYMLKANKESFLMQFSKAARFLLFIVAMAMTIKLLLQLGSTIPAVSDLAFGFRPIVIAYLHLVLLLIISVFILTFLYGIKMLNAASRIPLYIFVLGVILNETVLAVQGIASFSYTVIPYVNEMLFAVAIIMLISSFWLFIAQSVRPDQDHLIR